MLTVSQSYSSQIYTQVQNASTFPGDRINVDKIPSSNSHPSEQSADDPISLSPEGKQLSQKAAPTTSDEANNNQKQDPKGPDQQNLSAEEQKILHELKTRDTEVRAHEQAHLSAAGQYAAGGASFSYQTGPDGKRYANGGEVPIDIAKEKTPEATIQKMRTVRRAALAPASPSATDRNIAAQASAKESQAMKELQEQTKETADVISSSSESQSNNEQTAAGRGPDSATENSEQNSKPPQVSEYSRQTMTSAYKAIAALAA